ncbi:hypothetical protein KC19_5G177600 [Ceratodon purpureus]|uniref:Uncharacterized protein n=1 Tax=Ceratodon purpureus TaxID=3225 RepID=A0A8T0I4S2_CERPU|nr:hypothetical protein KC19_5G177600 [Ceratodon purpureus]
MHLGPLPSKHMYPKPSTGPGTWNLEPDASEGRAPVEACPATDTDRCAACVQ